MTKRRFKSILGGIAVSVSLFLFAQFVNTQLVHYPQLSQAVQQVFPSLVVTPTPTPTLVPTVLGEQETALNGEVARVKKVIDGDTVLLENGQHVRYIGMDTPESKKPNTPVQCFSLEAAKRNQELVEGKEVTLVKDVSNTDRYQRLLRYVYLDNVLINELLVKEGYAFARSYPPDISLQPQLKAAEAEARTNNKGLWSSCQVENGRVTN